MFNTLRSLARYRSLLITLTQRELKARYRGSVMGFFWSLINPLMLVLVYTFVFNTIFQPRDSHVTDFGPYGLFLATGVIPWIWVQASWFEGTQSLIANSGLIRKASFPAELLPVVSVLSNLVHFLLALPILFLAFPVVGWFGITVTFGWSALLVPLVILIQVPQIAGLALGFAALNVHFKDVKDILSNLLTMLFFLTPILYTLATLEPFPWIWRLVASNPFTPFLLAYQECIFYGRVPSGQIWLAMVVFSALFWALGTWLFGRLSETLAEAA